MRYLKHLLLTDSSLLRGHVNTGEQRLSTFLNSVPKSFLEMEEVTFISHVRRQILTVSRMLVRIDEILLAHEMEAAGDEYMRVLAGKGKDQIRVTVQFGGATPVQITGKVSKRAIERDVSGPHDFIVMTEPDMSAFKGREPDDHAVLAGLPYVIVDRSRIAFILQ